MIKISKRSALMVISSIIMAVSLCGCGGKSEEAGKTKVTVAYQYGLAYSPLTITLIRETNF